MKPRPKRKRDAIAHPARLLLPAALALFGIVLLLGCSSDEITSPAASDRGSVITIPMAAIPPMVPGYPVGGGPDGAVAGEGGISGASDAIASKVIDRETGGIIRLEEIKVNFKPHALDEDTEITIVRLPSDSDKILFELLPHGIEFNKAVTLTLNLEACGIERGEAATIYWFNPEKEEWVDLRAAWSWPIASVKLDHFSKYGGGRGGW
jgi:hypothetical protein